MSRAPRFALALPLLAFGALAHAQEPAPEAMPEEAAPTPAVTPSFLFSGWVEQDARVGIPEDGDTAFIERSRSSVALRAEAMPAANVRGVFDARAIFLGDPDVGTAGDLSDRARLDPFRLDVDAAFVEVRRGRVQFRAGRQTIRWGSGLLFNPTSLVSPPDLEDPLRFGQGTGNEMAKLDAVLGPVKVEALAVPRFRPALLPRVSSRELLAASGNATAAAIAEDPAWLVAIDLDAPPPDESTRNVQAALRMSGTLPVVNADAAISWYHGRTPLPQLRQADIDVDFAAHTLIGTARADYPAFEALGVDLAGELFGAGWWAEGALVAPFARDTVVNATSGGTTVTERERDFARRYVRAAVGADYRTAADLWFGAQWVRGFLDEFGAEAQNDYVFLFAERPFLRDSLRIRFVGGMAVEDRSLLLSPEVGWAPADSALLSLSAYAGLGDDDTKFGRPLVGPPVVIGRARLSF